MAGGIVIQKNFCFTEDLFIADGSVFQYFTEAVDPFVSGQRMQEGSVSNDRFGLVKGTDQIFSGLMIDTGFTRRWSCPPSPEWWLVYE
jgi:hypothetical protein